MAAPAAAQNEQDRPCAVLCAPELKIEPTFTIEHLAQRHRIEVDGEVERVPRETVFELVLFRHVKSLGPGTQPPPLARLNGVVSLVLWVTVIVCGRMITFYRPNVCQPGQALGVLANCIVR